MVHRGELGRDNLSLEHRMSFQLICHYRENWSCCVYVNISFCYRGHNEIDDPSFTQPVMYQVIENRQSVPDIYADSLVTRGVVTHEELQKDVADYTTCLNDELKLSDNFTPIMSYLEGHWKGLVQASEDKITTWDTGIGAWYTNGCFFARRWIR